MLVRDPEKHHRKPLVLSGASIHITAIHPSPGKISPSGKAWKWLILTHSLTHYTSSGLQKIQQINKCLYLTWYCSVFSFPITASFCSERSIAFSSSFSAHISLTRSACGATQLRMRQQVGRTDGGQQGNSEVIRIRTMNSGRQTLRETFAWKLDLCLWRVHCSLLCSPKNMLLWHHSWLLWGCWCYQR